MKKGATNFSILTKLNLVKAHKRLLQHKSIINLIEEIKGLNNWLYFQNLIRGWQLTIVFFFALEIKLLLRKCIIWITVHENYGECLVQRFSRKVVWTSVG